MSEDKPLGENIKTYYQASQEEFELSRKGTTEEIQRNGLEKLTMLLPEALETLSFIMRNGDKDDAIRFSASRLVIEHVLGKPAPANNKEGDLEKILRELTKQPVVVKE